MYSTIVTLTKLIFKVDQNTFSRKLQYNNYTQYNTVQWTVVNYLKLFFISSSSLQQLLNSLIIYVSHVHITFSCFNVIFIFLLFHSLFPPFCPPPSLFLAYVNYFNHLSQSTIWHSFSFIHLFSTVIWRYYMNRIFLFLQWVLFPVTCTRLDIFSIW